MITLTAVGLMTKKVFGGIVRVAKKIPRQVWVTFAVVLLFIAYGSLKDQRGYDRATAENVEKQAKEKKVVDGQIRLMGEQVKVVEKKHREDIQKIVDYYIKNIGEGYAKRDKVIADLQSGTTRLRKHWQGCTSNTTTATTDSSTGSADEEARLRAVDTGNLIRAGSDADTTITALQAIIEADRKVTCPRILDK